MAEEANEDRGSPASAVTQIYMPLRSNAAWFSNEDTKTRLERQIKAYILLYDRVLLQDGRYQVTAGVDGQGMRIMQPGDTYSGDRSQITYYEPGRQFGIEMQGKPVLSSVSHAAYEVDFFPIIHEARYEDETFIRWSSQEVGPEIAAEVSRQVNEDLASHCFDDELPENRYLKRHILDGLYRDAIVALLLGTPFAVDSNAAPLVAHQIASARHEWSREIPSAFFDYWITLELPDLTELSWWDLREFRESPAGKSFREMVHRIARRVTTVIREAEDQRAVDDWIAKEFNLELVQELSKRIASPGKSIVTSCLNFIPFGSIAGIAADALQLESDQSSWVSLVASYKSGSR